MTRDLETRDLTGRSPDGPVPERFGRYRVVRVIGSGAMGVVYLAEDESLGRQVAVKTLGGDESTDSRAHQRFFHEARAVAALGDPNIVALYDLGVEDGTPYIVMELVKGRSLAEILAGRGRLAVSEVCTIGIQMARALARAHEAGIVHRDVKPANILDAGDGSFKLADFGVARLPDSSLTMTGVFLGTPAYAAPEALLTGEFHPAGDVFSLGAVLYECLTGTWPQKGKDVVRAVAAFAKTTLAPPSQLASGITPELDAAVLAAVAARPGDRPTAIQLAESLALGPRSSASAAPKPAAVAPAVVPAPIPAAVAEVPPTIGVESIEAPVGEAAVGAAPVGAAPVGAAPVAAVPDRGAAVAPPASTLGTWVAWSIPVALAVVAVYMLSVRSCKSDRPDPASASSPPAAVADAAAGPRADAKPERLPGGFAVPEPDATSDPDSPPWPKLESLRALPDPYADPRADAVLRERWRLARALYERGDTEAAASIVSEIDWAFPESAAARTWLRWYDAQVDDEPGWR